jgi:hypothetical protein
LTRVTTSTSSRELGTTTAANKELAADLAQFTIDNGTVIIGVEEVASILQRASSPAATRAARTAGLWVAGQLVFLCTRQRRRWLSDRPVGVPVLVCET